MPHKRAKHSIREQTRSKQGNDLAPSKHALSTESIPKSVARVLNAAQVQQDFRDKKRKLSEDYGGEDLNKNSNKRRRKAVDDGNVPKTKGDVKIQPGESLSHFNRRVEETMRPLVHDAMQASAAVARKVRKEEEAERAASKKSKTKPKSDPSEPLSQKSSKPIKFSENRADDAASAPIPKAARSEGPSRPQEFATYSTSAPRRLNDIVQAPPELKQLPRGATRSKQAATDGKKPSSLREGMLSMAQKAMLEEERERVVKAYRELKKTRATG